MIIKRNKPSLSKTVAHGIVGKRWSQNKAVVYFLGDDGSLWSIKANLKSSFLTSC